MQPVTTASQMFDAIQNVKRYASGFVTNFFPVQNKIESWIAQQELFVELSDHAAFFFKKDNDFLRLYFAAGNPEMLRTAASQSHTLKTVAVVADVVGEEPSVQTILSSLESVGLCRSAKLMRMALVRESGAATSDPGAFPADYAEEADCLAIWDALNQSFDPGAEQIPSLREVVAAVKARQIILIRHDNKLAGLLFFETHGVSSHLRFWLVLESFRAFHYGSALMRYYLGSQNTVRRFMLWVMADNRKAIEKYQHYGFAADKLVDHVLTNRKYSHEIHH